MGRWYIGNIRALAVSILVMLAGREASAGVHPRFEPTDLELEDSGVMEVDVQLGPMRGPAASRIVVPDFELDLGLWPGVELDLDGAFGVEGAGHRRIFDHLQRDNLWASVKLGLRDWRDPETSHAWALGVQVGPKLPVAIGASGVGVEGIVLLGRMMGPVHLVFDAGGLVDPRTDGGPRPVGVEGGIDVELELVKDRWSLLGELGGIWYRSADPDQLAATVGIQWSATDHLDLSLVALVGFLAGSDPYGVLVGIDPKFDLW